MLKQRYECKQQLHCQQCGEKMLANNSNAKYCATCIVARIQARMREYLAKKAALRKAANGPVKCD